MNTSEKPKFVEALAALCAALNREASEPLYTAYWMVFQNMPLEQFQRGVVKAIESSEYMPAPSKLREYCGDSDQDRWLHAFGAVSKAVEKLGAYKSPDFRGDDGLTNAVIRSVGGWEFVCAKTITDFDTFFRHEFRKTYRALQRSGVGEGEGEPLLGITERENRTLGKSHIPCIVPINFPSTTRKVNHNGSLVARSGNSESPGIVCKDGGG